MFFKGALFVPAVLLFAGGTLFRNDLIIERMLVNLSKIV